MEKPIPAHDYDGTTRTPQHRVAIDTNLDTHLALDFSDTDTVSDLIEKLQCGHPSCFPNIGQIKVHALKIKLNGCLYHLFESMFLKTAFVEVSHPWVLWADVSRLEGLIEKQHSRKSDSGDLLTCLAIKNNTSSDVVGLVADDPAKLKLLSKIDGSSLSPIQTQQHAKQKPYAEHNTHVNSNILSLDCDNRSDPMLEETHDLHSKEFIHPGTHTGSGKDNSGNGITDGQFAVSLEGAPKTASALKKKRKTKKRSEDEVHDRVLKENEGRGKVVVTHDMEMGSKEIADDTCTFSSSQMNKTEVQVVNAQRVEATPRPAATTKVSSGQGISESQCTLGDKQNGSNASFNHLFTKKIMENEHVLTISPSSRERKKKKTRKSVEFPNQVVGENNKAPSSSDAVVGNAESKLSEKAIASGVNGMRSSEDNHNIEAESIHPSTVQEANNLKDTGLTKHDNVIVNDCQKFGSDIDRIAEEKQTSQNIDSRATPPVKCTPSKHKKDMDSKEVDTCHNSNLLEANGNVELGISSKKRRKSKNIRDPVAETTVPSSTEHATSVIDISAEPHETVHNVHSSGKSKKGETILFSIDEKEVSKTETVDTSVLAADSEPDNVIRNVLESLHDVGENPVNVENSNDGKSRTKIKRKRSSASKSRREVETEYENVSKNVTLSIGDIREEVVDASSELTKKTNITKTSSEHPSNCEPGNNVGVEMDPLHNQLNPGIDKSSLVVSRTPEGKNESKPLQDVNGNDGKSKKKNKRKRSSASESRSELQTEEENASKNAALSIDDTREVEVDASSKLTKKTKIVKTSSQCQLNGSNVEPNNNLEVSCESDRIIAIENFVPVHDQRKNVVSDTMLVGKATKTKKGNSEVKASKEKKKLDVNPNGPTPDLQSSMKLYENQVSGGKAQAFKSNTIEQQRSLSKGEGGNHKPQPGSKHPNTPGTGVSAPPSNKSNKFNSKDEEVTRPNPVNATRLGKDNGTIAASNSSMESSKNTIPRSMGTSHLPHENHHHPVMKKVFNNSDFGEVVNNTEQKKSLLATPGAIFKGSNWSSDDEDGADNSDTSTRTPSDNSNSSEYSDGDSGATQNGFHSPERRGRNITKSGMNLSTIFRSSSRYKAAKLTASQSQHEDTESQPVEFVPESEPQ